MSSRPDRDAPLRIDLLGPVHPWRGGIAHYTARLAQALSAQGHDPRVVTFTRQYPGPLFPGTSQYDASEAPIGAVAVDALVDSVGPWSWRRAATAILARKPQLLVIQWWHPFFAPAFGAIAWQVARAGVPVVHVCHNVLPHEASPVDAVLTRLGWRWTSRFVVHARSERARLRQLVPDAQIAVCPHPPYDCFVPAGPPQEPTAARALLGVDPGARWLLFFGLIRPYKGLDLLLEALAIARRTVDVRLLVAGEVYGDPAPLHAQIARLGLQDAVHLTLRYLANEEVTVWMAASDVVVVPYRHATQSGIVQVAYAAGRPVITTAVGGLPEVVAAEHSGLLVPPEDPVALAAAIVRFYAEDLGPTLTEGARALAASLTWEALAAAVVHGSDAVGFGPEDV